MKKRLDPNAPAALIVADADSGDRCQCASSSTIAQHSTFVFEPTRVLSPTAKGVDCHDPFGWRKPPQ